MKLPVFLFIFQLVVLFFFITLQDLSAVAPTQKQLRCAEEIERKLNAMYSKTKMKVHSVKILCDPYSTVGYKLELKYDDHSKKGDPVPKNEIITWSQITNRPLFFQCTATLKDYPNICY